MCEYNGCKDQVEGKCMTKDECERYAKKYPGYTCSYEYCKGNDCVCSYYEQPLCEDNGCKDQEEGKCMTNGSFSDFVRQLNRNYDILNSSWLILFYFNFMGPSPFCTVNVDKNMTPSTSIISGSDY